MTNFPISFSINPNPAQDEILLSIQAPTTWNKTIETNSCVIISITDALGNQVYSGNSEISSGTNIIHVNTRKFPGGMYQVRLHSAIGSINQSFVKVK